MVHQLGFCLENRGIENGHNFPALFQAKTELKEENKTKSVKSFFLVSEIEGFKICIFSDFKPIFPGNKNQLLKTINYIFLPEAYTFKPNLCRFL